MKLNFASPPVKRVFCKKKPGGKFRARVFFRVLAHSTVTLAFLAEEEGGGFLSLLSARMQKWEP